MSLPITNYYRNQKNSKMDSSIVSSWIPFDNKKVFSTMLLILLFPLSLWLFFFLVVLVQIRRGIFHRLKWKWFHHIKITRIKHVARRKRYLISIIRSIRIIKLFLVKIMIQIRILFILHDFQIQTINNFFVICSFYIPW